MAGRAYEGSPEPGRLLAAKEEVTALLVTTTDDGWPHVAMLSVGELTAVEPHRPRAALWPSSTATANLRAHERSRRCAARRDPAALRRLAGEAA